MPSPVEAMFQVLGFRFNRVRESENHLEVANLYAYDSSEGLFRIEFDYEEQDDIELRCITLNAVDAIPSETDQCIVFPGLISSIRVTRTTFCTGIYDKFATEDADFSIIISDGTKITVKPSDMFPDLLDIELIR